MGGKGSKPIMTRETAREVLSRRNQRPEAVLGLPKKPKLNLQTYNAELQDEMSKVLKIKVITMNKEKFIEDSKKNANVIRFHRDEKVEKDRETGIVKGHAQLNEADLVGLFDNHRDLGPDWEPTRMAEELNCTVDEVLILVRSARLPSYRQDPSGRMQAF